MNRRLTQSLTTFCLLVTLAALPVLAEVWNYPQPDADRDVKDTAFYQAPAADGLIPNITAGRPRRVILLIGDGMSVNHVALARNRAVGPAGRLYMEQMPVLGLVRTHAANQLVTDSAAAATALACGVKTDNGRIGTTPDGVAWQSILKKAQDKGFRTALVATSTLSHATPAGFAANVENRGSEADIAAQLIDNRVDILFGGGRKHWLPAPAGSRKDDRSLIEAARAAGYQIAYNREQLDALKPGLALGLFADDGMTTFAPEPMLADMAQAAIRLLNAKTEWFAPDPRFFIMIEGSQIDWAAHGNDADNAIRQTLLFDMTVKEALDFARRDKHTLVIVTADHETGGLLVKADKKIPVAAWNAKGHTAGDVPLYAFGPGSPHFAGTHDNTDIPKIIARLLNIDNFPAPLKPAKPARQPVSK